MENRKEKWVAIVLALLLGGLGIHKFYLGRTTAGVIYLLFCWTLIPAFIAFIDLLVIAFKRQEDFDALYNSHVVSVAAPPSSGRQIRCPECREVIWSDARRCRFCGHQLVVDPG